MYTGRECVVYLKKGRSHVHACSISHRLGHHHTENNVDTLCPNSNGTKCTYKQGQIILVDTWISAYESDFHLVKVGLACWFDGLPVNASRLPLALRMCIWREVAGTVVIPSSFRRWALTWALLWKIYNNSQQHNTIQAAIFNRQLHINDSKTLEGEKNLFNTHQQKPFGQESVEQQTHSKCFSPNFWWISTFLLHICTVTCVPDPENFCGYGSQITNSHITCTHTYCTLSTSSGMARNGSAPPGGQTRVNWFSPHTIDT